MYISFTIVAPNAFNWDQNSCKQGDHWNGVTNQLELFKDYLQLALHMAPSHGIIIRWVQAGGDLYAEAPKR